MNPSFPTPTGMGGDAPNLPDTLSAQPQVQVQPQPSPQDISVQHDTLFGRAAKALMGGSTSYHTDQNGNTVAVNSPNSFQSFAKNVLAAGLLGAAAGANGNPAQGFAGGFARGGAAGVGEQERQDLIKRQQAQQEFQNQQNARREQREEQAADSEDQLRKAQIAHANALTYQTNVLTQGADFKQHQAMADWGKQHISDYEAAGLKPVFKDVPESEMQQTLANRPGASTFDWEPTGVKVGVDDKGQPTYQTTYSAFDPKGGIPVSQGTIDQWKKDGMDKFYPELFNIVKAGKTLDAQQYIELKRKDTQLYNENLTRQKNEEGSEKHQAEIRNLNAQTAAHLATAAHARTETGMLQMEKTQQQAISNAYEELNKVGGDFDKLTPKSKLIIADSQAKLIPALETELNTSVKNGDQDHAKEVLTQIEGIRSLSQQAIRHGAAQAESPENGQAAAAKPNAAIPATRFQPNLVQEAIGKLSNLPKETALKYVDEAPTLSDAEKIAVKNQLENPKAPTFGDKVANIVQNSPTTK